MRPATDHATTPPRRRDIIHVATPLTPHQLRLAVVEQVAHRHGLDVADLLAPSSVLGAADRHLAHARAEAATALRDEFNDSFPRIGRLLGNRNHSTIKIAITRHRQRTARAATAAA